VTLEYAIWLDEFGRALDRPSETEVERVTFDIDPFLSRKRAAVAAHWSQTSDLIHDDPDGFRLSACTISRLTGASESYWRSR
jgi:hypothetical protein